MGSSASRASNPITLNLLQGEAGRNGAPGEKGPNGPPVSAWGIPRWSQGLSQGRVVSWGP